MSENESTNGNVASRRAVVGGFMGVGIGVPLLAACGSDSDSDASSDAGSSSDGGSSSGSDSGSTTTSGAIGKSSEVPVGGGKIYKAEKVVVTQPTEGDFKAFSSICTHQGCPVTKISGEDIDCTCHGSKFSIKDGSVVNGPATKGLETLKVSVANGEITVS